MRGALRFGLKPLTSWERLMTQGPPPGVSLPHSSKTPYGGGGREVHLLGTEWPLEKKGLSRCENSPPGRSKPPAGKLGGSATTSACGTRIRRRVGRTGPTRAPGIAVCAFSRGRIGGAPQPFNYSPPTCRADAFVFFHPSPTALSSLLHLLPILSPPTPPSDLNPKKGEVGV